MPFSSHHLDKVNQHIVTIQIFFWLHLLCGISQGRLCCKGKLIRIHSSVSGVRGASVGFTKRQVLSTLFCQLRAVSFKVMRSSENNFPFVLTSMTKLIELNFIDTVI